MEATVYEEICRELGVFAKEYNLDAVYDPIDKDNPDVWGVSIYNKERTWAYKRLFSESQLEMLNMDKYDIANFIINDIRKHLKEKGVI